MSDPHHFPCDGCEGEVTLPPDAEGGVVSHGACGAIMDYTVRDGEVSTDLLYEE